MAKTKKQKVFIACESKDEVILGHLLSQLSPLERNGKIEIWHNQKVVAGSDREQVILDQLKKADLILLLISSTFIASDFFYNTVLPAALLRAKKPKVHLIPIIARSCMWEDSPIGSFAVLPTEKVPILSHRWGTSEEPHVQIVKAINRLLKGEKLEATEEKKQDSGIGNILNNIGNVTGAGNLMNHNVNIGDVNINTGDTNSGANEEIYLDQAAALFRQKKYEAALLIYDKVLAINPRNETAYYNQGQSFRLSGKIEKALAAYEMAIAINPNWWRVYLGKGRLYETQGDNTEAIKWYQRALKANPNIASVYFQLAYVFHMTKRYEEAISYYDRCMELDPTLFMAYLNKGSLLRREGKAAEALALYQQAAQLEKGKPAVYFNMGNAYMDLRQYKLALKNYEITLQLNPNHSKAIAQKKLALKKI